MEQKQSKTGESSVTRPGRVQAGSDTDTRSSAGATRRRWVRRLFIWVGLLVLLGGIITWRVGTFMVAPAHRPIGPPPPQLPAEEVAFTSLSGCPLAGWYVSADKPRGVVVLLHPIRGDRLSMVERAELFWNAGFDVLLFDFQAHGESGGERITVGHLESYDVRAAVAYAKQRVGGVPVVLVGRSLGAAAAVLASPVDVDAMILESMYSTIDRAVDNRVRKRVGVISPVLTPLLLFQIRPRLGFGPEMLRPLDRMAQLRCPVLVMGGGRDWHTTEAETRQLYAAAREPRELCVFERLAHQDFCALEPERYRETVLHFLDEHVVNADRP